MIGHLAPRQHIAEEGGGHHQKVDDTAKDPQHFAWRLVGAVIEPAEHVNIDGKEEHRRAIGVNVAEQPAIRHIAHDTLNRRKRAVDTGLIVHGQDDTGQNLNHETDGKDAAESVPVVQILRGREIDRRVLGKPDQRQTRIKPFREGIGRRVGGFVSTHLRYPSLKAKC